MAFFVTRVVVYGLGLYDLIAAVLPSLVSAQQDEQAEGRELPPPPPFAGLPSHVEPVVLAITALLCGGMLLNLVWFKSIVTIAMGGGKKGGKAN
eukprot:SAG22_NODE_6378_length_864_cov_1.666667_1_plen_94_part_00